MPMPMPCRSSQGHGTARPSRDGRAVALRRTAWSEHGMGMASVNQTRPHCVNQMGKAHSKPLAAHGRVTAWARHVMCESAFNLLRAQALFIPRNNILLVITET